MADASAENDADVIGPATAVARKLPPPEPAAAHWTRIYTIASFWLVVVLLGVPLWHKTTSIYRAELPLQLVREWAEGKVYRTLVQSWPVADSQQRCTPSYAFDVVLAQAGGTVQPLRQHRSALSTILSTSLSLLTLPAQQVSSPQTSTNCSGPSRSAISSISESTSDTLGTQRILKPSPTYHISISLLTATSNPLDWSIEAALSHTFHPLLAGLKPVADFTLDTQIVRYAALATSTQPIWSGEAQSWILTPEALRGFVNAAEWPLQPAIGAGPTINFLLYVPAPNMSPLAVRVEPSTAGADIMAQVEHALATTWLVPQWGAVAILNPNGSIPAHLTADDIRTPLQHFSKHLLSLLGIPPALSDGPRGSDAAQASQSQLPVPLALRLRTHALAQTLHLLRTVPRTLDALGRVTARMPSIPVPLAVARSVAASLASLQASCAALRGEDEDEGASMGRGEDRVQTALRHARDAEKEADKAFFEKSMLSQGWFPEEHKIAVYLPLLGPVGVPLIVAGLREGRWVWDVWKWNRGAKVSPRLAAPLHCRNNAPDGPFRASGKAYKSCVGPMSKDRSRIRTRYGVSQWRTSSRGHILAARYRSVQVDYAKCSAQMLPYNRCAVTDLLELANITVTSDEIEYLRKACPYLRAEYLQYLSAFRLKPSEHVRLHFDSQGQGYGALHVDIAGLWVETILYEIPLLALISEAYFRFEDRDWNHDGQKERARQKGMQLLEHGCLLSEFGTRRRRDYHTQELVLQGLLEARDEGQERGLSGRITGTSNVHFAMRFGIMPIGTVAHEWFMGVAAITDSYETANEDALARWVDTFGPGAFATDIPNDRPDSSTKTTFAQSFAGVRQDSGDPMEFINLMRRFYDAEKITDKKTIVFSDSLNVDRCIELKDAAEKKGFQPSFGVGTFLTSQKSHPMNIVIKLHSAGGRPAIKISDNMGKNTGDEKLVAEVKKRLGYQEKTWEGGDEGHRWN
ncbi:hypothetical protein MRB53_037395 [Persea americana]|nr:hypothetical protein MRB53_037395 [Persea americana]